MTARDLEAEAKRALRALRLEVDEGIADDVESRVLAWVASARAEGAGEERARVVALLEARASRYGIADLDWLMNALDRGDHCPAPPAEKGPKPACSECGDLGGDLLDRAETLTAVIGGVKVPCELTKSGTCPSCGKAPAHG